MKKNEITFVALNRAEGPTKECYAVVFYVTKKRPVIKDSHFKNAKFVQIYDIRDSVLRQFFIWGMTAPQKGGYDKVDFCVNWRGRNNSYTGRFDMKFGGTDDGKSFWANLESSLNFYAGLQKPDWMEDFNWTDWKETNKETMAEAQRMLNTCEIPVL